MIHALVVLAVGVALLIAAARIEGKRSRILHLMRHVGIALIVAVVVTGVFELYERTRQTEESETGPAAG